MMLPRWVGAPVAACLLADGSGRITVKNPKNGTTWHFDFDAGKGPRIIHVRGEQVECGYRWKPM
jgi:hypothetical protein